MSVYNGERYLREAIDSILNQTFTDFEFIVIDDGSTDGTADILRTYTDPRVRVISQQNQGLTISLNRGIAEAHGIFIARQDADDRSFPERFAIQVAFLSSNKDIALVGSAVEVISGTGKVLATFRHPGESADISEVITKYNCFWHGSVMFRRESFLALGGYSEAFVTAQDYDMWLRFSERYLLANLRDPLYAYRFSADSITVKRMVSQHRLAVLARQLAETRKAGGSADELLADVASYLVSPLSLSERQDIINNYKPWCRLLLKNYLPHEATSLMTALFRYHPSLLFRVSFAVGKILKSPSLLTRFLDHA